MIAGSLLLVVVAGVLLGLGLAQWDEPLLYSAIGVSALAALALVAGVRRLAALGVGRSPRPVGRAAVIPQDRARS